MNQAVRPDQGGAHSSSLAWAQLSLGGGEGVLGMQRVFLVSVLRGRLPV